MPSSLPVQTHKKEGRPCRDKAPERQAVLLAQVSSSSQSFPGGGNMRRFSESELAYARAALRTLTATRVYLTPTTRFEWTVHPTFVGASPVLGIAEIMCYKRDLVYEDALLHQVALASEPACILTCRVVTPFHWCWFGSVMRCDANDVLDFTFRHYTSERECNDTRLRGATLVFGRDTILRQPGAVLHRFCRVLDRYAALRCLIASYVV